MNSKQQPAIYITLVFLALSFFSLQSWAKPARLRITFTSDVASIKNDITFLSLQHHNYMRAKPAYHFRPIVAGKTTELELELEMAAEVLLTGEGTAQNVSLQLYLEPGTTLSIVVDNTIELGKDKSLSAFRKKYKFSGSLAKLNSYWAHYTWRNRDVQGVGRFEIPYQIKEKQEAGLKQFALQYYDSLSGAELQWIQANYPQKGKEARQLQQLLRDQIRYKTASALIKILNDSYSSKVQALHPEELQAVIRKYHLLESDWLYLDAFYAFSQTLWTAYSRQHQLEMSYSYSRAFIDSVFRNERFTPSLIWQDIYDQWFAQIKQDKQLPVEQVLWTLSLAHKELKEIIYREVIGWTEQIVAAKTDSVDYNQIKSTDLDPRLQYLIALNKVTDSYEPSGFPLHAVQLNQFEASFGRIDPAFIRSFRKDAELYRAELQSLPRVKNEYTHLTYLKEEAAFRELIEQHKGKVVLLFQMPHYHTEKYTELRLSHLSHLREQFKGEAVVFIKLIHERTRNDYPQVVRNYVLDLQEYGELENTFYINKTSLSPFMNSYLEWNKQGAIQIISKDGFKLPIMEGKSNRLVHPTDKLIELALKGAIHHEGENDQWLSLFDRFIPYKLFYDEADVLMLAKDVPRFNNMNSDLPDTYWRLGESEKTIVIREDGLEQTFTASYVAATFTLTLSDGKESRRFRLYEAGADLIVLKRLQE